MKILLSQTKHCKICFKEIRDKSLHNLLSKNNNLCEECFSKFEPQFIHFDMNGVKGLSIYKYDECLKELIYKYKGCYDIELKSVFLSRYILYLKTIYLGYKIIPMPSYYLDDEQRGFNHVLEIAKLLNLPICRCIEKTEKIKQADLNYKERKQIGNVLKINNLESIKGSKILLFDDICTTGSTLRAAIQLVRQGKPKKIKILTIAKNIKK